MYYIYNRAIQEFDLPDADFKRAIKKLSDINDLTSLYVKLYIVLFKDI